MSSLYLPQHRLGSTDIDVSALGFGTVKLGRDAGVKYPEAFVIPDDNTAKRLLHQARDLGINLIDTAPAYGVSEERLGKLLRGQRRDWVICSKTGEDFSDGESSFNFTPEHTRLSVERSLRRLHTDWLDLVLVHSDGNDLDIINGAGTLEMLAELKQKGWIRAFGMSTKTVEGGLLAARYSDCVMVTYNLNQRDEAPVLDYCHAHHKGVLLKKALASGHIAAPAAPVAPLTGAEIEAAAAPITLERQLHDAAAQPRADALRLEEQRDLGCDSSDPVAASMDFIFAHPGVSSAIVGTINPAHLQDNVARAVSALTRLRRPA